MNLPEEYANSDSRYYIIPISYEGNLTSVHGAKDGAKEIINASQQLEYFDERTKTEPFEKGIYLLPEINPGKVDEKKAFHHIRDNLPDLTGKFPIFLGGDHSITYAITQGIGSEDFSVVMFDAHADFRHSWNNSSYNHACVSKNISKNHDLCLFGVRSMDIEEHKEIIQKKIDITFKPTAEVVLKSMSRLKNNVYISIDVDCLDPSIIRNTGTPEPSGMDYEQLYEALKAIFSTKNVIGVDICEFSPQENKNDARVESYILAKLVYHILGLKNQKP